MRAPAYILGLALLLGCSSSAGKTVRVVGSSTVFPFSAAAAEVVSERTGARFIVEQTGSGGGHKLICAGPDGPDATTSSRPQEAVETQACLDNGVGELLEIELGLDGIVLARSGGVSPTSLSRAQIYRALAAELPDADCQFDANPNRLWSDVDSSLPKQPIVVHGPPPTSGTRDAFGRLIMEAGASAEPCLRALEPRTRAARAQTIREDGAWVDAGENDNALVQTVVGSDQALGVMGWAGLQRNSARLSGVAIDGVAPDRDALRSGDYPVMRMLYAYIRKDRLRERPALAALTRELTSDAAQGADGYLARAGLLVLEPDRRAEMASRVEAAATSSDGSP